MSACLVIRPTAITDAILGSSNVLENDFAAWASTTAYAVGDKCIVLATHRVYEALQAHTNQYPPDTTGGTTPYWLDTGATNRWVMFDSKVGTRTTNANSISVTLSPGRINSLALMEVAAATITVTLTDPVEGVVYSKDVDMTANSGITDMYAYFFEPIIRRTSLILTDIPPYSSGELTVTISDTTAECGLLVVGNFRELGRTLYGLKAGIADYSVKSTDSFGNTGWVKRDYANTINCDLFIKNNVIDETRRILAEYRSTPVVWVTSDSYDLTVVYGAYIRFEIVLPDYGYSQCNLEIEGLI